MGLIDTTMMNGLLWSAGLQVPAEALWATMMLAFVVSVAGILLNVTTRPRQRPRPLRLATVGAR